MNSSARRGGTAALVAALALAWAHATSIAASPPCPDDAVLVLDRACVDRFEASLVRVGDDGSELGPHAPNQPVLGAKVRAKNARGVVPQAYVSRADAEAACRGADKRLCTADEWLAACRGARATRYPYGERRRAGACNDHGAEPLAIVFARPASRETWGFDTMNDPRLHLVAGGVARTGRFDRCQSEQGVHDMVGNLHEWTAESAGTLRGGYYQDTQNLGEGCDYAAVGHDGNYRDYSTGFRCCKDSPLTQ